jgi:stage V sporulation protein D (sporulation-specific penicillin-binding protein)
MNQPARPRLPFQSSANRRLYAWYGVLILIGIVIILRLFYLQVIRHDYYRQQALNDQLKEYSITAERGVIKAHDGTNEVPVVLNEKLFTLYADPTLIKQADKSAANIAAIIGGNPADYKKLITTKKTRYVVIAKRLNESQSQKLLDFKMPGIGTQAQNYRTYPQGSLAAQLLGFVNGEGKGTYGLEQALNKQLAGTPGTLKAITDAAGVPLAASRDNVQISPKNGDDLTMTLDVGMQAQLEKLLKAGLDHADSKSGSALIMDVNTGAVRAMANYPTYDPAEYFKVSDPSVFNNAAVSSPLEVGSIMKTLTAAAALDQGVIGPGTTYYDPSHWLLDGHQITNIEEDGGAGTHSIADILNLSINTGATWMLMQMGGQTGSVNQKARDHWHDYMVNHYQLGKVTGIEQGYEAPGTIPSPSKGYGLSLTYANTAFGQAMTATPLQMAAALSAVLNGGTYYKPHLVDSFTDAAGKVHVKKAEVIRQHVVSKRVSGQMQALMEYVVAHHNFSPGFSPDYSVGGKTGTAQIADPAGGYYASKYNGTYLGFVGGDKPQYVIVVRVNEPHVGGYAGTAAAQPVFGSLAHMLINDFGVNPKTGS